MTPTPDTLEQRLSFIQNQLLSAVAARPRGTPPVLIGVAKGQPVEKIAEALAAGLLDIGENKVQEAAEKWPELKSRFPAAKLHLIGSLQTNKAREAVALADMIHSLDRIKLADALANEMAKQGKRVACLIQVNTGEEPQKGGVLPAQLDDLLTHCRALGLPIVGLMCVPPAAVNPAPHFAFIYKLARARELSQLSMGMSSDYETAARLGSTMVRIGTALFGARG